MVFCLFLSGSLFSQESVYKKKTQKDKVLSFYVSGTAAKLKNANYTNDPYLEVYYPVCLNAGASYTKYFTDHLGLTIGLEYSNYKNNFRCAQYNKSATMQTDINGSSYYTITQADYSENRTLNCVEVPICLRLETSVLEKTRLFADIGIKLCSSVSAKIKETGSVTTMGLYPDPNAPNAGFLVWNQYATNWQTSGVEPNNDYTCKNLSAALYCNAGIMIPVNNRIQFTCSCFYTLGLGDINESEKGAVYTNYLGVQKAYASSTISSLGTRVGILLPFGSN